MNRLLLLVCLFLLACAGCQGLGGTAAPAAEKPPAASEPVRLALLQRVGNAAADRYACFAEACSRVVDSSFVTVLTFPVAFVLYFLAPCGAH
jgi:hypothetical protein